MPVALAGVAGIVAAGVALAVAEVLTALARSWRSPILDVGDRMVDVLAQSSRLKELAIDLFGTADKAALLIGIGVLLTVYAFVLGVVALRKHLSVGIAMVALFAIIGVWAARGRAGDGSWFAALPTLAGAAAAAISLALLHGRTPRSDDAAVAEPAVARVVVSDRRQFLGSTARLLGGLTTGAAVAGVAGRQLAQRRFSAAASRKNVSVPTAEEPLPDLPPGVQVDVEGMRPFLTPNEDFYRIDTALELPQLSTADYTLTVKGLVDEEVMLTWQDLLNRPMIEHDVTLCCVSNRVGGNYIDNARWIGARLDDLLRDAGPRDDADMVVGRSVDGFECGFPLEVALDGRDAMVAVSMNGEALPIEHGFPARLVVPGLYGYVSATKWLTEIELTRFDEFEHYWERRGWAERGPIKLQSRIDVPGQGTRLAPGDVAVAGVAWAQHVGVSAVEVRFDDGPWEAAELAAEDTIDTWRQWVHRWDAAPGRHTITVRATDADGNVQTEVRSGPKPDGATGHHQIDVVVVRSE